MKTKKANSKSYSVEIEGKLFELRPDTPFSADVYVDDVKLPKVFSLNYSGNVTNLHPSGKPSDEQQERYLNVMANYLTKHPEVLP
jgi:hypothetical protein